jgi:predicted RNA-binding Zn ribbon-like protein
VDLIGNPAELRRWLAAERERLGGRGAAVVPPREIRELRDAARALLRAAAEESELPAAAVAVVNAASRAAPTSPLLETESGSPRRRESPSGGESAAALLGLLARSVIELLTGPERERLRICRAPSCGMLYLGSRRWCCAACGNRARAARHYARRRTARSAAAGR